MIQTYKIVAMGACILILNSIVDSIEENPILPELDNLKWGAKNADKNGEEESND